VTERERRTYLQCRLIEAWVIVLLNGDEDRAPTPELKEAVPKLDHAITLLDDDFRLWRAWLRFQKARALIRLGDDAKRGTGPQDAPDGEIVSSHDRARRLWVEARRSAEEALDEFASVVNRYGAARCRLEIGQTYARELRYAAAVQPLEEARETFFFCGDRLVEADTAVLLAQVRIQAGELAVVKDELDFAQRVYRGINHRRGMAEVRRVRNLMHEQRARQRREPAVSAPTAQGVR
jgi:hypothetical protein